MRKREREKQRERRGRGPEKGKEREGGRERETDIIFVSLALELQPDDWLTMYCWGYREKRRTLETCSNWQHKLKLLFTSKYHNII